jgi:hypothetical protein
VFNYKDDNALINQFLTPLEVGHEVHTAANAHSFVNLSAWPTLGGKLTGIFTDFDSDFFV